MASIKCNKCGKELNDNVKFCNKCGNKISPNTKKRIFNIVLIIILILTAVSIIYSKSLKNDTPKEIIRYKTKEILACDSKNFNTKIKFYFGTNEKIIKYYDYDIEDYSTEEQAQDRYELIKTVWDDYKGVKNSVILDQNRVITELTLDFQENPKLVNIHALFDTKDIKIDSTPEEVKISMETPYNGFYWTCYYEKI